MTCRLFSSGYCVTGREGCAWGTRQLLLARWAYKNASTLSFRWYSIFQWIILLNWAKKPPNKQENNLASLSIKETVEVREFRNRRFYFNHWLLTYLYCILSTGQLISATTEEIVKAYYPSYFLLSVAGQIQTKQVEGNYDDSYLGEKKLHLCQLC